MFDFFKELFGLNSCRRCVNRRMFGLFCGLDSDRPLGDIYAVGAWHKDGCWYYVDKKSNKQRKVKR